MPHTARTVPIFVIKHRTRGFFTAFDEERAMPLFSPQLEEAKHFPSHSAALFELIHWHRSKKYRISILELRPTQPH